MERELYFMKNRPAYKLKTFITIYNILQVFACIYIVQEILNISSTSVVFFWKCNRLPQDSHIAQLLDRLTTFAFWLKVTELTETIVFVLRKKQRQVSFLHMFHHCSTISIIYLIANYYKGSAALYPLFLNSNVHIIMYTYYLAAALCNESIVRKLLPIKKSITILQMIQFIFILLQVFFMSLHCEMPKNLVLYYYCIIGVIFYGFYDFYKKSYTKQTKS